MVASEVLGMIKDTLLSCAAIVTGVVAILGLKSWRRELHGRAGFEVARSLMRVAYRLREEIQSSRSRIINNSEFPLDYNSLGSNDAQQKADAWAHVYNKRWQPVRAALLVFDQSVLEAAALWGHEIQEKTDKLRKCAEDLRIAMEAIIGDKASSGADFAIDKPWAEQMRSVAHASRADTGNPFTKQIADAITDIEAIATPHLRRS